ncbi:EAL domain-containing protein, partial [Comamonas thiooxydans]|uniref:EAL domain-containing protein n=1 Tax=Comamonas thiooxydans TaxID=363952 RepID=UPI00118647F2
DLVAFALIDREHARYKTSVDWRYILLVGGGISFTLIGFIVWVSRLQLSPAKALEQAIRNREFVVHYQPIIELSTRRCIAAEALVRWQQQGGRLVPPDQFIPLAEASGLISSLTNLVVETVTSEMGTLLRSKSDLHVSINISVHDIESAQFLLGLTAATAKAGIDQSQIWLEVTERSFMNVPAARKTIAAARDAGFRIAVDEVTERSFMNVPAARKTIAAARDAGFRIAVDDFGTGYSSLALLDGLPLDALKIDKSFVDAIGHDAAQNIVTRHIIGMAHELKLAMIAEGVETREQETYLKNAGVQFGQGWLYAKALPAEQFIALLTCSPSDEGLDNHGNLRVLEHEA